MKPSRLATYFFTLALYADLQVVCELVAVLGGVRYPGACHQVDDLLCGFGLRVWVLSFLSSSIFCDILFYVYIILFIVCGLLSMVYCLLLIAYFLLFVVCCVSSVFCCSIVWCVLCVVCCLLFVVCWLLVVGCCWLFAVFLFLVTCFLSLFLFRT